MRLRDGSPAALLEPGGDAGVCFPSFLIWRELSINTASEWKANSRVNLLLRCMRLRCQKRLGGQSLRTLNVIKSESDGKGNKLERFGEKYFLAPRPVFSPCVSKILSPPWLYSTIGPLVHVTLKPERMWELSGIGGYPAGSHGWGFLEV